MPFDRLGETGPEFVEMQATSSSSASSATLDPQSRPTSTTEQDVAELAMRPSASTPPAPSNKVPNAGDTQRLDNSTSSRGRKVKWSQGIEEENHDMRAEHREQHPLLPKQRGDGFSHVALDMPADPDEADRALGEALSRPSTSDNTPDWSAWNTPEPSRPPSPGDHDVDFQEGERDGLPQSQLGARRFNAAAAKLIGTHRAKNVFLAAARKPHNQKNQQQQQGVDPDQLREALSKSTFRREEQTNDLRTTRPPTGTTGVLSSILRLYDNPEPSASSSQATLINHPPTPPHQHNRAESPFFEFQDAFRRATGDLGGAVKKTAGKMAASIADRDRPQAARSNAGVFGALQAGALDLAGVASPIGATIRPNAASSGTRVSRFKLEDGTTSPSGSATPPKGTKTPPTPPISGHSRNRSNLSLTGLTDLFDPHKYHTESHVLKHYKASSAPGTPAHEVPSYDKIVSEKNPPPSRKKPKKKAEEVFITMHVAAILQRQDFILRLARALMMFGAPSHRFESALQQTGKVLDVDVQVIYLLSFMLLAFQDRDTHTSELKIIKQNSGLNLHKLRAIAVLHWEVMHDKIGVQDASTELSRLMVAKPTWNKYWSIILGGLCSAFIGAVSFNASFIDLLISFPLGCAVIFCQIFIASRSELLSNCFEIFIAVFASFIAAALQATGQFCYAAVISSTIVLILPGWLVCCAALELQSRNIVTGSVRLIWAIIYSLFLGFGIAIGSTIWNGIAPAHLSLPSDMTCSAAHSSADGTAPWWRTSIVKWWAFLLVPGYSVCLSLKNQAKLRSREFPVMVVLSCIGWTCNYFSSKAFEGQSYLSSALGALAVSFLANLWGKYFQGAAFIVATTPIMFQLPSGLGAGGFLNFATSDSSSSNNFQSGMQVAEQLLTVSIGLVIGIIGGSILLYPFSKSKGKRAKDLMSF